MTLWFTNFLWVNCRALVHSLLLVYSLKTVRSGTMVDFAFVAYLTLSTTTGIAQHFILPQKSLHQAQLGIHCSHIYNKMYQRHPHHQIRFRRACAPCADVRMYTNLVGS